MLLNEIQGRQMDLTLLLQPKEKLNIQPSKGVEKNIGMCS